MTIKQTRQELESLCFYQNPYMKYTCIPKIQFAISRIKNEKDKTRLSQIITQIETTDDPFDFNRKIKSNADLVFILKLINEAISIIEQYE